MSEHGRRWKSFRGAAPALGALALLVAAGAYVTGSAPPGASDELPARPVVGSSAAQTALDDVDWRAVDHPLDCGRARVAVLATATGDATGDGAPEAAVAVSCAAGAGNPPSSLYVYGPGSPVRLLATLVGQDEDVHVSGLDVGPEGVRVTGAAYSSPDVPNCCPDVALERRWTWSGAGFVAAGAPA